MEYPYESLTFKQIYEFLGKYVKINLLTGFKTTMTASIEGYLYTIDPITKTVVLFKEKENLSHNESNNMEVEKDKNSKEEKEKRESEEENDKDQNKIVQGVEVETKTGDETNTKIETETEMETEMEIETKNQAKKNIIDNYQIIVIMKSVIQTLSIITEKKPLTEEYLEAVIPDQNIIYIEKTDSIQNLKQSLIQYLEKGFQFHVV